MVFSTPRLTVRIPFGAENEIDLCYRLWTDPRVMVNVGFPEGLSVTRESIARLFHPDDPSEYDRMLLVELTNTGVLIGECKLGKPDDDGIAQTDVKLLPEYWGRGLGTELKQGLVDYLFIHTSARAIKATPNKGNIASQRMQEKVGGKRVGEGLYRFPEHMRAYTVDVPHYEYMVFREDWELRRETPN
jgi:RimJ/RimL family protein N-acetyltransferase